MIGLSLLDHLWQQFGLTLLMLVDLIVLKVNWILMVSCGLQSIGW
jgi:hypothetical protein